MGNSIKDTLHELITNLSKSEKRYFKIYASRHIIGEENNYSKLFDFLSKQTSYDENKIFEEFKGEDFLNKFSITKKRLYDHIIHSLDQFHSVNSIEIQIYRLLSSAEILSKKSLYSQSLKQLKSAKKIAEKHNLLFLMGEINAKLKNLYENLSPLETNSIDAVLLEDQLLHEKQNSYNYLWHVKTKFFILLNLKGSEVFELEIKTFENIIHEIKQNKYFHQTNFDSHYLYNHLLSAFYFSKKEYDTCFEHLLENIALIENNPIVFFEKPNKYISVLTNAVFVAFQLKKHDYLDLFKQKLLEMSLKTEFLQNEDIQMKLFSSYYSVEITILLLKKEYQKAKSLIPLIEEGLVKYQKNITAQRKAFFNYKIACVFLLSNNLVAATNKINEIINSQNNISNDELLSMTYILNLIIQLETKDVDFIQYAIRNTNRFLKNKGRMNEFESIVLKYFNKISKAKNEIEKQEIWEKLNFELEQIHATNIREISFEYFDFLEWSKFKSKAEQFVL